MMWPWSEINKLKAYSNQLCDELRQKETEIEYLSNRPSPDMFFSVAKEFDAKSIAKPIIEKAVRFLEPMLRDHLIDALKRIDFGDRQQTKRDPSMDIAYADTTKIVQVRLKIPELNYVFQVYNEDRG